MQELADRPSASIHTQRKLGGPGESQLDLTADVPQDFISGAGRQAFTRRSRRYQRFDNRQHCFVYHLLVVSSYAEACSGIAVLVGSTAVGRADRSVQRRCYTVTQQSGARQCAPQTPVHIRASRVR